MDIQDNINDEIKYFEAKAKEYDKDEAQNTAGIAEFWRGKAEAHRYAALKLKRVLEWHGLKVSKCAHDFIDIDYKIKQCVKCKEYLDLLD